MKNHFIAPSIVLQSSRRSHHGEKHHFSFSLGRVLLIKKGITYMPNCIEYVLDTPMKDARSSLSLNKKHITVLGIFILLSLGLNAQVFISAGGSIQDFKDEFHIDSFRVDVKGLPDHIDQDFGLAKVCFSISHPRVSDIKVELVSPDGSSIWLSNRNGENGWGYSNTCFRSNGFSGYIHQGTAPFEGEYIPDGRFSFVNNGQDPNGSWYLLVRDLRKEETGNLHVFSLEFSADPMPNLEQPPCDFEKPESCHCAPDMTDCRLLPDLVILESFTKAQIKEYAWDDPSYPGQLRFAASIANIGDGPMETQGKHEWLCGDVVTDSSSLCPDGSFPRQKIYQRIYRKEGAKLQWEDIVAGTNYFDAKPGHDHYHVDNWVEFRLVKRTAENAELVAKANKVSYCLFDSGICNNNDNLCRIDGIVYGEKNLPNYGLGNYSSCKSGVQGISVGGYDTYGMLYEGQFVQLPPDLPSGEYFLEIEIDPEHHYIEKDKSNNIFSMQVSISKQQVK